ncbi:hypothetical protein RQP46_003906 [Phenoliferia psychrophenolica]
MAENHTGNPYEDFASDLFLLVYPSTDPNLPSRLHELQWLLVASIVLAGLYTMVNMRRSKQEGNEVWFVKLVSTPQGSYLLTNQSFMYPAGAALACTLWLRYLSHTHSWWFRHTSIRTSFYWSSLSTRIPTFLLLSLTTLSYLSSSNLLVQHSSQTSHHPLSPRASNALFLFFGSLLIPIYISSMRTGAAFAHFVDRWGGLQWDLDDAAKSWPVGVNTYVEVQKGLRLREAWALHAPYRRFREAQRTSVVTDVACFLVLLFVNLAGISLLTAVRWSSEASEQSRQLSSSSSTTGTLEPSTAEDGSPQEVRIDFKAAVLAPFTAARTSSDKKGDKAAAVARNGHRLGWDITLLYFGVVPVATVMIAHGMWVLAQPVGADGDYKTVASASLLAITLKRLFARSGPRKIMLTPNPASYEVRQAQSVAAQGTRRSHTGLREGVLVE